MVTATPSAAPDEVVARLRAFADGTPWVLHGDLYGTLRADTTAILDALAAAQARERADTAVLARYGAALAAFRTAYDAPGRGCYVERATMLRAKAELDVAALAARRAAATGAGKGEEEAR